MNYLTAAGLIFISRLAFLSPWLEDWDSVQFSLGLHDFNLALNQPHAPGYILYIFSAKILYFFTKSDIGSLNLLSAIAGTFAVLLTFLITKNIFNKKAAIISSLIIIVTPISWMMSVTPLTNIVGLASFLAFIYFIYKHFETRPLLVSLIGGLILGFRATELPIIISLMGLATLKYKKINELPKLFSFFILGMALWIIPTIFATGLNNFISAYKWIAGYVINHDSIATQTFSDRLNKIGFLLDVSFTPWLVAILILVLFVIMAKKYYKEYRFQFLLVWLLSYLTPLLFVYNLEVPRYTLPLLPPAAILLSYFLKGKYIVTIVLLFLLITRSFSQLTRFQKAIPPSIAPVLYTKQNYDPQNTFIIASFIYRQFEHYAPEFVSVYEARVNSKNILNKKYAILDYLGLVDKLPKGVEYKIVKQLDFSGDQDIFSRLSKVSLYILELNDGRQ